MKMLKFMAGNAKLSKSILTFSLPAGWTCPFAHACLSKADPETGHLQDGPEAEFRCYSAMTEAYGLSVRRARWYNLELLKAAKTKGKMAELILGSLPTLASYVRLHVAGDFYKQSYFDTWLMVATVRPETLFYGYTKALSFWLKRRSLVPENFVLTASYGGTEDHLITEHQLRYAKVVFSPEEAEELNLQLDHDDSLAMSNGPSFGLLLHGQQGKGTPALAALQDLQVRGIHGYNRKSLTLS